MIYILENHLTKCIYCRRSWR